MTYDVIICGGGPAGAACAAFCAAGGLTTLVLEKATFPRDKVCGDCLNPSVWPVLDSLALSSRVLDLPHSKLAELEFIGVGGRSIRFPLHPSERGEIAVRRRVFDDLLLQRAVECGAEVRQDTAVTTVTPGRIWKVSAGHEKFSSRLLIAADGRNSTVLRLLGLLPRAKKDRVSIQAHIPAPRNFGQRVVLQFLPEGYCGHCSIGESMLNLCFISHPTKIDALKHWAESHFAIDSHQTWRTITPLTRDPVPATARNLLLIGDSARVVEPFTGEGTYYALASAELAAKVALDQLPLADYRLEHARLYSGRLWVNRISKYAALNPQLGSLMLDAMSIYPPSLRHLASIIIGPSVMPRAGT